MKTLEKCPLCGNKMIEGKLGVINQLHGAKLVFEDKNQTNIRLTKIGFDRLYIDQIYYCSNCEMFAGFTNKK